MILKILLAIIGLMTGVGAIWLHHRDRKKASRLCVLLFILVCLSALVLRLTGCI